MPKYFTGLSGYICKKETMIQNILSGIENLSIWNRKRGVYTELEEILIR